MRKKIVIGGGTGLLGNKMVAFYQQLGFDVYVLTRSPKAKNHIFWDPINDKLDVNSLKDVQLVINLAGAGLFDARWTKDYLSQIVDSRVKSTSLLAKVLNELATHDNPISWINASAVGYYGDDTGNALINENSPKGNNFVADLVDKWEKAATNTLTNKNVVLSFMRIGIVLDPAGGALKQMLLPIKLFVGSPLGSGKQIVPWIHVDDVCEISNFLFNGRHIGVFNVVAPNPIANKELTKNIANVINKPLWAPAVPAFVLKLLLGKDKAMLVLGGNNVSSQKLISLGFQFKYNNVIDALNRLLKK